MVPVTFDVLSKMDENELNNLHSKLNSNIYAAYKAKRPTIYQEIDLCYVQRELKIRARRREAHSKYQARRGK